MTDVYQMITNKMIEQLENGVCPWQKPWASAHAVSHTNGKPYSLLNQFLLDNMGGEWLTFKQIESEGGSIIKGEKAHFVTFWKFLPKYAENENGEKEIVGQYPILKFYYVWHISQCTGIKEKYPVEYNKDCTPIESAEKIVTDYIKREELTTERTAPSEKAFYSPHGDFVRIPKLAQFAVTEEYYSTLFHELTHSTGAEKRLNREGIVKYDYFGSAQYSKEELIAEMGAAFLTNIAGLDTSKCFNNSAAYIQGWLKELKNDKKLVISAAAKAEQAAKYILTGERPTKD